MTWLRTMIDQKWFGGRRRPKGEEHPSVKPMEWYRVPQHRDSHLAIEGTVSLCGRELEIDEVWWFESGWEDAIGGQYLIVDERKTGKCGPCKTALKGLQEWGVVSTPAPAPPSPFQHAEDEAKAKLLAKLDRAKFSGVLAVLRRAFPNMEVIE